MKAAAALLALACARGGPPVVVVGGGVAGLSAAVEVAPGAPVVLVEGTDRLGGSTRDAMAITALPDEETLARWDAQAGGPDAARERYVHAVVPEVIEWTGALGLVWMERRNPAGDGVALTGPVGGGQALVDVLVAEAARRGVAVRLGQRVVGIDPALRVSLDTGETLQASAVVLATGGFMGDLDEVRERLGLGPVPLLRGVPAFDDGNGLVLGEAVGASVSSPAAAVFYAHGTPSPDAPEVALVAPGLEGAWVVDAEGRHLDWLSSARGDSGSRFLALPGGRAWAVLDSGTAQRLQLRDSETWRAVRGSAAARHRAGTLAALAAEIGVPAESLAAGLAEGGAPPGPARPLAPRPPYVALELLPTTAKALSGLVTDLDGRLLDGAGAPIPGFYAAGEVMGFGHPYGGVPVDSTMNAGAVLTGRAAGRAVLADR